MPKSDEVIIEYDEGCQPEKRPDHHEDSHFTLSDKINQVLRQLQEKKARVVFDLTTNTCNILPCEGKGNS